MKSLGNTGISFSFSPFSRGFGVPQNMVEIGCWAKKQHKILIWHSLLLEQPQPLLDNDYILSVAIHEYANEVTIILIVFWSNIHWLFVQWIIFSLYGICCIEYWLDLRQIVPSSYILASFFARKWSIITKPLKDQRK